MALTSEQMERFAKSFKDSPLLTKWSDFEANYLPNLDAREYAPGQTIYGPGSPPTFLFLVTRGTVRETWRHEGAIWLQQDYEPGQFFNPRALFLGEHESTAVAVTGATLFRMTAADLRVATEHNADLYDSLLQEKRAGRLRRIPLLRNLTDAQVRSLAAVITEQEFAQDAPVPLADKPGLWIIDWGQVEVTGPANIGGAGWPKWRLTAGNFFTTPNAGVGANCAADDAKACRKTLCYYLPAEAAKRLSAGFPDVAAILGKPLNIVAELEKADLFQKLSAEQREHLAQHVAWEFIPAGQNVTTQGNIGHSFVILRDGAALITALDDRGRLRPRNYLKPSAFYGRASLLAGQLRDATVRAVPPEDATGPRGAELILLDRRDMQAAFKESPHLWPSDDWLVQQTIQVKEEKHPYFWMEEGETVLWQGRSHIFWLVIPLLSAALLIGGTLLVLYLAVLDRLLSPNEPGLVIGVVIVLSLLGIPTLIWLLVDYFNDYYVVTNRRVTRRDRVWLFYEARIEVPIDMVQDVTLEQDFWGRIINYGDLTIRTAAKPGSIVFAHVPDPNEVKEGILSGKGGAVAAVFGQRKESLRRGLISGLHLALPVPERKRALGDIAEKADQKKTKKSELLPGARRPPGVWRRVASVFPASWQTVLVGPLKPDPKPLSGQIVWRKSYVNLLVRGGLPFTLTVLWSLIGIAFLVIELSSTPIEPAAVFLVWILTFFILGGWTWWQWQDWFNDIYVVTDDQIIDLEQRPLGLSTKRRASGLDRVQTVDSNQEGLLPNLLNYGDVIIRTAAGDEGLTFSMVSSPKEVQAIVFQKLVAFQRRQEQKRTDEHQRDLIEGLDVYHELRQSPLGAGIRMREGG